MTQYKNIFFTYVSLEKRRVFRFHNYKCYYTNRLYEAILKSMSYLC